MATSSFTVGAYTLTAEDLHPRDGIRWAVGQPDGQRSSTWRLWGDKKGDAYLAMRSLGGQVKVSIHRDRRCSVGFTKEFEQTATERFGAASRHWDRWVLPDEPVVRAVQVVVPDSELAHFSPKDKMPMAWVRPPSVGRAVVFSVFVAEPPNAFNWESPEKSGQLLRTMITKTRFTWVVHGEQELDAKTRALIEDGRTKAKHMTDAQLSNERSSGLRIVLWGQSATPSDLFFIELDASNPQSSEENNVR